MSTYIFTGPTLSAEAGRVELDAIFLAPVSQGDIFSLCRKRPIAIGIIDGYFERVPAVWHKEILWAMSEGIHVFGAASMGALRAAELHAFGMVGVGRIFDAYLEGAIEDDDEVAVIHGPSEAGYLLASEAMVNIRRTLAAAESVGIVTAVTHRQLVATAKRLFYAERQYHRILTQGLEQGLVKEELAALGNWLPNGRIDQKRADAIALLRYLREWRAAGPAPKRVGFAFQHTDAWEQLRRETDRRMLDNSSGTGGYHHDAPLAELKLKGDVYAKERQRAIMRSLCLGLARAQGLTPGDLLIQEAAEAFCRDQGLREPNEMDRWLEAQDIDGGEFDRLLRDEARIRRIRTLAESNLERDLLDHLRVTGQYGALAERAGEKQRLLASYGLERPSLRDVGLAESDLWRWYFEERLGVPVPADLLTYVRSLDFRNVEAMRQAVLRELCFARLRQQRPDEEIPVGQI
jgi:hypothetical protein